MKVEQLSFLSASFFFLFFWYHTDDQKKERHTGLKSDENETRTERKGHMQLVMTHFKSVKKILKMEEPAFYLDLQDSLYKH